ncbi:GNAT family N-acetyltransferase [Streptomyces sp. SHP 1-2]|uniref:GNAT family N-acetyltransferase n=1 Tax=Streptomyces sp. SHP 1-2 TaxID=2769489 RepID=UPI002239093A|nr:GNAT family N-acetyltransferase [Streptomyces sp. SHP 1-2]MCW5250924.1 GNAT family N-acetyltransferase [Streptomyces sp. SHP 1-2]
MTTTLRPTEPLQQAADGTRSRHFQVCVNSRPVGAVHLATDPSSGGAAALIHSLSIDEPDRRRGRGTVAALAAEEVARSWGCRRLEAAVPAGSEAGTALARALGYTLRNRNMAKRLDGAPPALPPGSTARAMAPDEFGDWLAAETESYVRAWTERGMTEEQARAKARHDHEKLLPHGADTEGMLISVLEHEGTRVGTLWLALQDERSFVFDVEADAAHRGRGHGRTLLLLAEAQTLAAGRGAIGLNVFAGNTPAERLYEGLGYVTTLYAYYKPLL